MHATEIIAAFVTIAILLDLAVVMRGKRKDGP